MKDLNKILPKSKIKLNCDSIILDPVLTKIKIWKQNTKIPTEQENYLNGLNTSLPQKRMKESPQL